MQAGCYQRLKLPLCFGCEKGDGKGDDDCAGC
jgi:hypothetical protein